MGEPNVFLSHCSCVCSSGFLLFLRGFINYARIRKMADTLSTLPRTRVLFIYWAPLSLTSSLFFPSLSLSPLSFSVRHPSGFYSIKTGRKQFFFPLSAWHNLDNATVIVSSLCKIVNAEKSVKAPQLFSGDLSSAFLQLWSVWCINECLIYGFIISW